jgi:hypothetical protein
MVGPVDDEVFQALQAQAEPLVDDVNAVLRRLLGLTSSNRSEPKSAGGGLALVREPDYSPPSTPRRPSSVKRRRRKASPNVKRPRAKHGSILPEDDYELPILRTLDELGGRAPSSEVIEKVGAALGESFQPADFEELDSGLVRWRNRTQFVRLGLIRAGDMKKGSPRGVWEISDQGRRRLANAS